MGIDSNIAGIVAKYGGTITKVEQGVFAPTEAQLEAQKRRLAAQAKRDARQAIFIDAVVKSAKYDMQQRVQICLNLLQDQIVRNISVPVDYGYQKWVIKIPKGPYVKARTIRRTTRHVVQRSKPGEFPRAETTTLRKSIFHGMAVTATRVDGFVGTPIAYGVILETRMDRSFLLRTWTAQYQTLIAILSGPNLAEMKSSSSPEGIQ